MWSQNITIGDLHYLRSKFAEKQGSIGIELPLFNRATEAFYNSRQYAVSGNNFITWGHIDEEKYLSGNADWLDNITNGTLWLLEADMRGLVRSAMKELSNFSEYKQAKYLTNKGVRIIHLRKD
jgi:hypothetical protein